jgi:hypothetical protein
MKYMDGVVKNEFGKTKRVGYPEAFLKLMTAENGGAVKMVELKTDTDMEYKKYIYKGDEFLSQKDYAAAKTNYEEALNLKQGELYPKGKIEKINKVLSEIEELHKSYFLD